MVATFQPPTFNIPFAPPLDRWHTARGMTVYRAAGTWTVTTDPYWQTLQGCDVVAAGSRPGGEKIDNLHDYYVFLGGRVYTVSDTIAAEITAGLAALTPPVTANIT